MKKLIISITLAICSLVLFAQTPSGYTGEWKGLINAGAGLTIVFHIQQMTDGHLETTADSPDQSAFGLKCDTTFISNGSIIIEMRQFHASFSGSLTNDSTIDGMFTQGGQIALTLHRNNVTGVEPAKDNPSTASRYKTTDLSIPLKDVTLYGTYTEPLTAKVSVAVLIIAGSGPTDRDGNSNMLPGKNNSLLQLADSLASHGIASLRYDKRGIGKSQVKGGFHEDSLTIHDIADDAEAMYHWLEKKGLTKIFIAGHSEGSLIGMLVAPKVKPAGFISIAGAGRKAGIILTEQLSAQVSGNAKNDFIHAIDSLEKGFRVKKINPALLSLLRPSIQSYMISWLRLDPAKLVAELPCPALIIQGTKDLQVTQTDANKLHEAQPKSTLVVIDNMNHVLKEVKSDERADNVKAYSDPDLPLMEQMISSIVNFITQSSKRK